MVRPKDQALAASLRKNLIYFSTNKIPLPGIAEDDMRECFIEQLLESIHRIDYIKTICKREFSVRRKDPEDTLFDPIRASILHRRCGDIEEAFWLVFLFVHFGKHAKGGWRYLKETYGSLGIGNNWTWNRTSANPADFRAWLDANLAEIKRHGVPGGFGNHRKYQSLDAYSKNGTGSAVETYVAWIDPPQTHQELFTNYCKEALDDPRQAFHLLFRSMNDVVSFGRTAKLDYLAMVGKLGLAPIEPKSTYMQGSTGPSTGARLLFCGNVQSIGSNIQFDQWLQELDKLLKVGMQVLEDALCNWQKSPEVFKPFRA